MKGEMRKTGWSILTEMWGRGGNSGKEGEMNTT